jgi:hypothetical protein
MTPHLKDAEFTRAILDDDASARQHLAECTTCRAEHEAFAHTLASLSEWSAAAAQRDDVFWARQQARIAALIAMQPAVCIPIPRIAWAVAAALIIMAAVLLSPTAHPPQVARADPDHELLLAIERSLDRDLTPALEPAAVLAEEMNQALHPADRKTPKETGYEN